MFVKYCPNCKTESFSNEKGGAWPCPNCKTDLAHEPAYPIAAAESDQDATPMASRPFGVQSAKNTFPPTGDEIKHGVLAFVCEVCGTPHFMKSPEAESILLDWERIVCGFCNQSSPIPAELRHDVRQANGWD